MASGFLALLDDISMLMDDVATMGKVAAKKTAGILGDDLAVNAEKASGFNSSREIPVLIAITKGSFINKLIILPLAFLLSAFYPDAIIYILLLGGIYLAYEGAEKIYEFVFHRKASLEEDLTPSENELLDEKAKIKSAIITDFILSIEIVILTLSTVVNEDFWVQVIVVSIIVFIATVGVYGIVALIVRMDDFGYHCIKKSKNETQFRYKLGVFLVNALPNVIRGLSFIGTIAMLLVAGGIYTHNIHLLQNIFPVIPSIITDFIVGFIVGVLALLILLFFKKVRSLYKKS